MKRKEQSECVYRGFWHDERWIGRHGDWRVKENHGLDLVERLENLVMTGAHLSSNEERVAL